MGSAPSKHKKESQTSAEGKAHKRNGEQQKKKSSASAEDSDATAEATRPSGQKQIGATNVVTLMNVQDAKKAAELLQQGGSAALGVADALKRTPLHYACLNGLVEIVEIFLNPQNARNVDVWAQDSEKSTPLHLLCEHVARSDTDGSKCIPIAKLILSKDRDVSKVNITLQDSKGNSCLHYAAAGQSAALLLLVASFCSLSQFLQRNAEGKLPIDMCQNQSDSKIRQILVEQYYATHDPSNYELALGVVPRSRSQGTEAAPEQSVLDALYSAIICDDKEQVKAIVAKHPGIVNMLVQGFQPIVMAQSEQMAELLLQLGERLDVRTQQYDRATPLLLACSGKSNMLITLYLRKHHSNQVFVNARNELGATALFHCDHYLTTALIDCGALVNIVTNYGDTFFHTTAACKPFGSISDQAVEWTKAVMWAYEKQNDGQSAKPLLSMANNEGEKPFHKCKSVAMAKFLMDELQLECTKSDLDRLLHNVCKACTDFSCEEYYVELAKFLLERGAQVTSEVLNGNITVHRDLKEALGLKN